MRIYGLNMYQPIFRAHSYEVEHKNNRVVIQTDNEKNLGNEPYLIYRYSWGEMQEKMRHEGNLYSANLHTEDSNFKYHILYKDTGNVDLKDSKEYQINPRKMMQQVAHDSRIMHRQPTILAIKEGQTIGKIKYIDEGFTNIDNAELMGIDKPTIFVAPMFDAGTKNPNIVGIIYTNYDGGAFSHITTRLRQQTDVCAAVFEPDIIEKLISLNGKNIELEIKDGTINFKETNKKGSPMIYPEIQVPLLKPCNKILTSKEYSPEVIGAKAVNLGRLERLREQGKINIIIPKSIALPHGYIQEMFDENPIQQENFNNEKENYICKEHAYIAYDETYCKERMDKLRNELFNNGIIENENKGIMIRSSFNGEDLPNYSAAGIYHSTVESPADLEHFYRAILRVAQSKWDTNALYSRKMHKIPDENIQYGVLLQQRIRPDYRFTLYTDDEKGNLKIDLFSGIYSIYDKTINPHIFTYNKKTGELNYDSIQLGNPVGRFNENQELISIEPAEDDLSDNKELFEQIKKVAENALVVEKEFGYPQDIEGGIKGDDIYFWQSRNIVR